MATLAERMSSLATGIANHIRDNIMPRVLPSGGTTGQLLAKSSNTNYATTWVAAPPKITVGTVAPTSPSVNDVWIDTN